MSWPVAALLGGQPHPFGRGEASAIAKRPLPGRVAITRLGLTGDAQADAAHHGGPDMALHLYPLDHHAFWRGLIGDHALLGDPGAFGSNLSVAGLDERAVAIGDVFRLGSATIEISRPRQPCWKIEQRFGTGGMVAQILATGRCGWYFRVLEEGEAEAGDVLEPVLAQPGAMSVAQVFDAFWGQSRADPAARAAALAQPALAAGLRREMAAKQNG